MTAQRAFTLYCDETSDLTPGQRCHITFLGQPTDAEHNVRDRAKAEGWRYEPGKQLVAGHPAVGVGRDICPRHRA